MLVRALTPTVPSSNGGSRWWRRWNEVWMLPPVDNEYSLKVDSLILMQHAHTVNPYSSLFVDGALPLLCSPYTFPRESCGQSEKESWTPVLIFRHLLPSVWCVRLRVWICKNRQDLSTCFAPSYRKITSTPLLSVALVEDVCLQEIVLASALACSKNSITQYKTAYSRTGSQTAHHSQWSQTKEGSWLMFVSSLSLGFFRNHYMHCGPRFWSDLRNIRWAHMSQQLPYVPRWEVTSDLWLGRFGG